MALLSFDGDNAYKKYAETSVSKNFKLVPIESIKIEGGEVSEDDLILLEDLLDSLGPRVSFTIDICGDIYSGVKFGIDDGGGIILTIGDVEKYGVCIRFTPNIESGRTICSCELDPKKYGKDLNTSYYLRVYAEASDLDVTNDYRFLVDKKRAVEYGEDAALFPTEPYIEETYDTNGDLIGAKLYGHTKIRYNAFSGCTSLALTSLPEGLTSIGARAFSGCTNLALTSLPEGLTSTYQNAFQDCKNLALTFLPESLTSIGNRTFYGCTSLTSITFKGTPTTISSWAFDGCTNLTDIKVPWSEGAVKNAPWGATNATITYNYTGA